MNITNDIGATVDLGSGVITITDLETTAPGLELDDPMAPLTRHYRNVLDTKETMVREALIKLGWVRRDDLIAEGWTPPPGILHSRREG